MNHGLSHGVRELPRALALTALHVFFTQSKKTHTGLNTNRSIT